MEYKLVYRAYSHTQLMGRQGVMRDQDRFEERSKAQYAYEADDWSSTLNELASDGYTVKNSGAFPLADNIVFWALMEKEQ